MKRRELLTGAAGAVLAVAPAVAQTQISGFGDETPIANLYREFSRLNDETDALGIIPATPNAELMERTDRLCGMADAIVRMPSNGAMDFVFKLMAWTFNGQHEIGDGLLGEKLWAEARALVGEV